MSAWPSSLVRCSARKMLSFVFAQAQRSKKALLAEAKVSPGPTQPFKLSSAVRVRKKSSKSPGTLTQTGIARSATTSRLRGWGRNSFSGRLTQSHSNGSEWTTEKASKLKAVGRKKRR
jgi:hypothetical protein